MRILIKLVAILLLLRILGGYAQAAPYIVPPTEKPEMDTVGIYTVNIAPVDFVNVEFIAP